MPKELISIILLPLLLGGCLIAKDSPIYRGEVPGMPLDSRVHIVRDDQGIPHIFSDHREDLFFGLGYTMAQDRLFQMDLYRHAASGRLAEWFGNIPLGRDVRLVQADILLRCFELEERARTTASRMAPEAAALLEHFVDGINHFIDGEKDPRPFEYKTMRIDPEPWSVVDVMTLPDVFGLGIALINLETEIVVDAIAQLAGEDMAEDFFRHYRTVRRGDRGRSDDGEIALGGAPIAREGTALLRLVRALPWAAPKGSNNWTVSGARTATGLPLLANDPHVPLGSAPSFWHHAHIEGDGFSVVGLLYPGYPAFGTAWNGEVAWGVTNIMADQIDILRERIDMGEEGDRYLRPDGWKALVSREERCKVRFGRDRRFRLRKVDQGFLVPPEVMDTDYGREFPWTTDPASIRYVEIDHASFFEGHVALMKASSGSDVKDALRKVCEGPTAFNYVWATREGDIGYHAAGRIPVREGREGSRIRDGSDPMARWIGTIPFDELPDNENPVKGFLATANERVAADDYPHYITHDYVRPYRSMRIHDQLRGNESASTPDMMILQGDVHNLAAKALIPMIEDALDAGSGSEGLSEEEQEALDVLTRWDRETGTESPGAALYEIFHQRLLELTFGDEMGETLSELVLMNSLLSAKVMDGLLDEPQSLWFDRTDTEEREGRDDILVDAFRAAVKGARKALGRDVEGWAWGEIHRLRMGHPFGLVPMLCRSCRIGSFPYGGDNDTVNGGYFISRKGRFPVVAGAASRIVVDCSRPDGAWFNCSTGMAGSPASPYFDNLNEGWRRHDYFWTALAKGPEEVRGASVLVLEP